MPCEKPNGKTDPCASLVDGWAFGVGSLCCSLFFPFVSAYFFRCYTGMLWFRHPCVLDLPPITPVISNGKWTKWAGEKPTPQEQPLLGGTSNGCERSHNKELPSTLSSPSCHFEGSAEGKEQSERWETYPGAAINHSTNYQPHKKPVTSAAYQKPKRDSGKGNQ